MNDIYIKPETTGTKMRKKKRESLRYSKLNSKRFQRLLSILSILCFCNALVGQTTVSKQLYLSDGQTLDRIDPVSTGDNTTASTVTLGVGGGSLQTIASDDFSSNSVSGGSGWNGDWVLATDGSSVPVIQNGEIFMNGGGSGNFQPIDKTATRSVDLSGYTSAELTLDGRCEDQSSGFEAGDTVSVQVSVDGGVTYTTLWMRNGDQICPNDGDVETQNIGPLSLPVGNTNTLIRLVSGTSSVTEDYYWDNVLIEGISALASSVTFTQSPTLCSPLTILGGETITVQNYITVTSGTMPASPAITAELRYGATNIITLTNPTYDAGAGLLTWTGTLGSDLTVPAGAAIELEVTTAEGSASFTIDYDSATDPSLIDLPVSTFINVDNLAIYDAAFPGGSVVTNPAPGSTVYIRSVVSDPFGFEDITGMDLTIVEAGGGSSTVPATSVATAGCTRTYEYEWMVPATAGENQITAVAEEGFEGTVTDSDTIVFSNCNVTASVASQTNVDCFGESTGSVDVAATGGTTPYEYSLDGDPFMASGTFSGLAAGTYTVTARDADGCTDEVSFTITQPDVLDATVSKTDITCFGENDGTITVSSPSGGSGSYEYRLNIGAWQSSGSFTGLAPGSYLVQIRDANNTACFEDLGTQEIIEPATLVANGIVSNVTCAGDNDGSITQTVSGGTAPYTYAWSDGGATSKDRTMLGAGMYTVTITDNNLCSTTRTYNVTQPAALSLMADVAQPECGVAGSIILTVSGGTSPYTFDWSDLAGSDNPQNRSNLSPGTYSVTVADQNGCTVMESYNLVDPDCEPGDVVCIAGNDAAVYSVDPDPFVMSYNWTVSNGGVIVSGQGTPEVVVDWTGATSGEGQVCVRTENDCGESAETCQDILLKLVDAFASSNAPCGGGTIELMSEGGVSYEWSGPDGFSSMLQNPVINNATAANSGTYTVTVTDEDGCSATATTTVTVSTGFTLSADVFPSSCGENVGAVVVTVTGGASPFTYNWSNGAQTKDISDLFADNYTLTVTDDNGCVETLTASVGDFEGPTLTASSTNVTCNGGTDGAVTLTVTGGLPPIDYLWSNGATTQDLMNVSAGIYNVMATDSLGCMGAASGFVNQPNPFQVSISRTNLSCFGSNDGTISLSVSGATPGYSYAWSDGGPATADRTGLSSGPYSVTITDAQACTTVRSIFISQPSEIIGSVVTEDVKCFGESNGVVKLSVSGGSAPYTYSWTGPGGFSATTKDIGGLAAGTYDVTVTDARGCSINLSGVVGTPQVLSLSSVEEDVLCAGGQTGSVVLSVSGGNGGYMYQWSNGATTKDISGLPAGSYTVSVTDSKGCIATRTVNITEPTALALDLSVNDVLCSGESTGSANVDVTGGTGPYSFAWSDGGPAVAFRDNLPAGNYAVTVTDDNGCEASTNFSITEPSSVLSAAPMVTDVNCFGGTDGQVLLTVMGGTPNYTYSWNGPNGFTANTKDIIDRPAGIYSVTVTDANGCTAALANIEITQPALLQVASIVPSDVICFGEANGSINATIEGGTMPYTYQWNNGATVEDPSGLVAGSYDLTVTDDNGCTATASVTVNEPAQLQVTATKMDVACFGDATGSIDLTVTGGTAGYSYAWSDGPVTSSSRMDLAAGTYTVTVTDANDCVVTEQITIEQNDAITVSGSVTDVLCNGDTDGEVLLSVNGGSGPYTYTWTGSGTGGSLRTGLAAGTYDVTVEDALGCTATATFTINQPDALSLTTAGTDIDCNGDESGTIDLTVNGGTAPFQFNWSNGASTEDLDMLPGGTYTVTVTDDNGCTATASLTINEPDPIQVSASTMDVDCFGAFTGSIDLTVTGGTGSYSYAWSDGPATTSNRTGLAAGTYTVTVTDANDCTATTEITIEQNDAISVSGSVTNVICNGGSDGQIMLSTNGGVGPYTYTWSDGPAMTPNRTGLAAGTYGVTVEDALGCTAMATFTVNQPDPLYLSAVGTDPLCNGGNTGRIDLMVAGGTPNYTYAWSDGPAMSQDRTDLAAGTYTVTVTDNNGCTAELAVIINDPAEFTVSITDVQDINCLGGGDGSATATTTNGNGPFTYQWSNGETEQTPMNFEAGNYSVTVTDNNGCVAQAGPITINEPATGIELSATVTPSYFCGTGTGEINLTVTNGTAPFSYFWTGVGTVSGQEDQTGLAPGMYSVIVTDALGCSARLDVEVTSTLTLGNPVCEAGGGTYSITFTETSGATITVGPGSYTIMDNIISGIPIGTDVEVTATNPNDPTCSITLTATSPTDCSEQCPDELISVGAAECAPDFNTYSVSFVLSPGTDLTVSPSVGVIGANAITDIPVGTDITLTATNTDCATMETIAITSPECCPDAPIASVGEVTCVDGSTYEYTFVASPGATAVSTNGMISGSTVTVAVGTNDTLIVFNRIDCDTIELNVSSPADCNITCIQPDLTIGNSVCNDTTYSVTFTETTGAIITTGPDNYTITGNVISGIQVGEDVEITATNPDDASCSITLTATSPDDCNEDCPDELISVSALGVCSVDGNTYSVSFTLSAGATLATDPVVGTIGTNAITGIPSGTSIRLIATNADCNLTDEIVVAAPDCCPEAPIASIGEVTCVDGSTYQYTFAASPGATAVSANGTISGNTVTVAVGTDDILTVYNQVGCDELTFNVTSPADCNIMCEQPDLTLGNGVCEGATYSVSFTETTGATITTAPGSYTITGNVISGIPIGTDVTVTATNPDDGACAITLTVTSPDDCNDICPEELISVSALGVCAPDLSTYTVNFVLSAGATLTTDPMVGTIGANTITGIPAGTSIQLIATDTACNLTDEIIVAAPNCDCPDIDPPVSGGDESYCAGDPIPALSATVPSGQTVDWYDAATGGTLLASGTTTYTPSAPGTYYAEAVETVSGCTSTTRTAVTVTEIPVPTITVDTRNPTDCEISDGRIIITATGTNLPLKYSINGGSSFSDNGTFIDLGPGTYDVVVMYGDCMETFGPVTLTGPSNPTVTNVSIDNPDDCDSPTGSITVNSSTSVLDTEYSIDGGQTWQASNTFNNLIAGFYEVFVRNSDGSCPTAGPVVRLEEPIDPLLLFVTATDPTGCDGGNGTITAIGGGGQIPDEYQFQLTGPNGLVLGWTAPAAGQFTFTDLAAGDYEVTIRNGDGTCAIEPLNVRLDDVSAPTIVGLRTERAMCQSGGSATLFVDGGETLDSYQYSTDGLNWTPGGSSFTFTDLGPGMHTLLVANDDISCPVSLDVTIGSECLELLKSSDLTDTNNDGFIGAGDVIMFSFVVTNTGDVPITSVNITDAQLPILGGFAGTLNPGDSYSGASAMYTVTAADVAAGEYVNQAMASGQNPENMEVADLSDDPDDPTDNDLEGDGEPDDPTVTIIPNGQPTANDDNVAVCEETSINVSVVNNDDFGSNGPAMSAITITANASNGTGSVNDNGSPDDPTDDSIDYTPDAGFTGTDMLTYEICDLDGDCDQAVLSITVEGQLEAGTNSTLEICQGETVTEAELFAALGGNPDPGGTWSPTPAGGGTYTYTHAATANCPAVSAQVVVTENPDPNTGLAVSDDTICEGGTATITISASESGVSYQLRLDSDDSNVGAAIAGTGGTISFNVSPSSTTTYNVLATNVTTACSAELIDKPTVTTVTCNTFAINDINQTPVNVPVSGNVLTNDFDRQGDMQTVISALADTDGDGLAGENLPLGMSTTLYGTDDNGSTVIAGTLLLFSNGGYDFTPAMGFTGNVPFRYTITDDNPVGVSTDAATVAIEVIGESDPDNNEPPVANDDTQTTEQDTDVSGNLLDNDSDPDGDPITVVSALADTDGDGQADDILPVGTPTTLYGTDQTGTMVIAGVLTLNANGVYTFDPEPSFLGEVPASYTIGDPDGLTDDATLTILVEGDVGNETYANDDANAGPQDVNQVGNVLDNDSDPENDLQIVTGATDGSGGAITVGTTANLPSGGTLTLNSNGSYLYEPAVGFVGTEAIIYSIEDNGSPVVATDMATLYLTTLPKPCVEIEAWVYLEGAAIDAAGSPTYSFPMRTDLNDLRLLPGQVLVDPFLGNKYNPGQPYSDAPWSYFGMEGALYDSGGDSNLADAGYPATVVDWVLVSLRETPGATGSPLCQAAALLHDDGRIELTSDFDCCTLDDAQSYYLVVEHRSHLIVMSDMPVPIVNGKLTYDFRNQQSYIDDPFGFGSFAGQKEVSPGVFVMYGGNGEQASTGVSDTDINSDDRARFELDNSELGEYRIGDYNLSGDTNFADRLIFEQNNGTFTSVPRD